MPENSTEYSVIVSPRVFRTRLLPQGHPGAGEGRQLVLPSLGGQAIHHLAGVGCVVGWVADGEIAFNTSSILARRIQPVSPPADTNTSPSLVIVTRESLRGITWLVIMIARSVSTVPAARSTGARYDPLVSP